MVDEQRLKIYTAWDTQPALSQAEIAELLAMFSKTDANGVAPGDPGYVATYNLRAAAREGWRWKLAKAAELQSTDLDGDRMSANQIFEHCERMVRRYSNTASPNVATIWTD